VEQVIKDYDELHQVYITFTDQQLARLGKQFGKTFHDRQPLLTWLINQRICPKSIISRNSYYWLDTINLCDSETGITLPLGWDTPGIFFQALNIVRKERVDIEKEQRGKAQNSNRN